MTQGIVWKDDASYPLNTAYLSRQLSLRPGNNNYFLVANAAGTGVTVKAGTLIPLLSGGVWKGYIFPADVDITTLDTGILALGVNYYAYLCDDGSDNGLLRLSANATAPSGYTTDNSLKLGGFHYGRKRNSITIADITSGCVVPNSVWDLRHRPTCTPEGMVYIGSGVWVDIYEVSVDEAITFANGNGSPLVTGKGKSTHNSVPLTGTEGLSGYSFIELARRSGKRLLTLAEWLATAHGSPQGNNGDNVNAWSATTNTARQNTGYVPNAISLLNAIDCVGNVFEWLDDYFCYPVGAAGNVDEMPGMLCGQIYEYGAGSFRQLLAGGCWTNGVIAGARCVNLFYYPWYVNTSIGCRFACDSL